MAEAARSSSSRGSNLPEWSRLLSRRNVTRLTPVIDKARLAPEELASRSAETLRLLERFFGRLALAFDKGQSFREIPIEVQADASETLASLGEIQRFLSRVREKDLDLQEGLKAEFTAWKDEFRQAFDDFAWCLEVECYPQWAYWWDGDSLLSAPTRCDGMVREAVDQMEPRSLVATSATMTLEGDFDFWVRETGLEPSETLWLDSPFNLGEQMQIWVVDVGLRVTENGYDDRVARVVERLCEENGGSTLVLLSSLRLLNVVAERMRRKQRAYTVLVQGDLPRSFLLEQFREDVSSVLVGSVSFREGIDVPGEGLSQVIIDRIPFPHPRDPLVQARDDLEERKGFGRVTLPTAKLLLRQATGRLIRSSGDRGRAVILDSRVVDRGGWRVVQSLPEVPFRRMVVKP
jgi:ATP-dependent DNA helicase DinG